MSESKNDVPSSENDHLPVEEYLKAQGRFAHLFTPGRDEALLARLQAKVDAYWDGIGL